MYFLCCISCIGIAGKSAISSRLCACAATVRGPFPRGWKTLRVWKEAQKLRSVELREWSLDCKVYVGNLGSGAAKHEIEAAFTKFGPLRNVWVARNPPGFAFVEFEDSRDAEDACRALDGSRLCGTRVRVEMSHGRSRRGGASRRPPAPPPR
ncbi:hypothetical protein HPB50_021010 [Hyalomma asiaticum]|uniref:Uncharacterized protein n=1 Tax=Hyalomma asiaticum TaxID=266040 RepID=A0ACB7SSE1_HYAAI|nr:hypothetical protein HPB50_021010 [Hyalomma asiaticum]